MYKTFYGLKELPFSISPDPDFLFLSETHGEALAHLTYGISQRKGFVVITGEVGTGKTTLIHALLKQLPQRVRLAFVSNPLLTRDEFLFFLADAFNIGEVANKTQFLVKFTAFLESAYRADENVVIIVDEAHCLTRELLEEIRLLSNLETPSHKLVNIILVGQPELGDMLSGIELRALRQRITLQYDLRPMTREETQRYIENRLLKAGARDLAIFTDAAEERIFKLTGGIPRLINILADHALLTGYVKETKNIDEDIVAECAGEVFALERKQGRQDDENSPSMAQWVGFFKKFFVGILVLASISLLLWQVVTIAFRGLDKGEGFPFVWIPTVSGYLERLRDAVSGYFQIP